MGADFCDDQEAMQEHSFNNQITIMAPDEMLAHDVLLLPSDGNTL